MSQDEHGFLQIYSDTKMTRGYSVRANTPGAIRVDDATLARWRRVESEFETYQNELSALLEEHPDCEM
jgi:hypothetical protein